VPRAAQQDTHPTKPSGRPCRTASRAPIILAALLYTHTDWLQSLLSRLAPFYPYAVFVQACSWVGASTAAGSCSPCCC